ncbi:MAG: hypothetical protein Q4D78_10325 [Neisseria zoodegmatis]|uniref:surface-adhesin E family protein n=1 Tax=Neisseria zoodegmatis TaxID=326523 RepID=UPI0026EA68E9|nr:surface-adhesin E family protein [Neisseria zoodegmatis]MDO5070563.1 hypothetical protein [Neisseria zoodegmatis]
MDTYRFFRRVAAVSLALSIAACSTVDSPTGPSVSGNWSSLGTTSNGNIKVSIDKNSIRKNGNLVTFRDRKVVVKPGSHNYANTPQYKTAIGTWEIHCTNKTYRLTALQLLDEKGTVVANETYTAAGLRPMSVQGGTITEKQFEAACGKKL